ncbi:hypothetical protein [Pilimelia columellifera]|uniref:Uncharacterized protein n=1 Tax=Pilimelia columellifera subsp. columellifera TaxID=706583 RepID=A0ABP6ASK3_9ACTN
MTSAATAAPPATRAAGTATVHPPASDQDRRPVRRPAAADRAVAFLDHMLDGNGATHALRLPQSYADQMGLHATAFTYDAAIAVLAYLSHPTRSARARARLIGDALLYAQRHDPDFEDGRLRQAYTVGTFAVGGVTQAHGFIRPDGTVNTDGPFDFRSSHTGDLAWAGIALAALGRRTGQRRYTAGAARLGAWVVRHCRSSGPLGGFRAGVDGSGRTLPALSTAHNAGLIALFGALAAATGDIAWARQRSHAGRFVSRMWRETDRCFSTVSADGEDVDRGPATLEAQLHPWLASVRLRARPALRFVHNALTVTDSADRPNSTLPPGARITGATFSTASRTVGAAGGDALPTPDPYAVWFEGTAQHACAARRDPTDPQRWAALVTTLAEAQDRLGDGQTVGGQALPRGSGLVAASSPLPAGVSESGYFPVRHVATTAWHVLAYHGVNPLQ